MKTKFIINSLKHKETNKIISKISNLKDQNISSSYTKQAGDAIKLTQEAIEDGFKKIISFGGDGTHSEVVNGFFKNEKLIGKDVCFGFVSLGSGNDFQKNFKPKSLKELLEEKNYQNIDLGKITFRQQRKTDLTNFKTEVRYFLNIAEFGFIPRIVKEFNETSQKKSIIKGKARYISCFLKKMKEFEEFDLEITREDSKKLNNTVTNVNIANGSFYGGGYKIAPSAKINDGFFDIVVFGKMGRTKFSSLMLASLKGLHKFNKAVAIFQTKYIEFKPLSESSKVFIEADGDFIGYLPATFEVLPKALKIIN
ncbi:MAG: YegS/Rv2252/BmrU family lipid kinase [Pseudomonadota bacterium]